MPGVSGSRQRLRLFHLEAMKKVPTHASAFRIIKGPRFFETGGVFWDVSDTAFGAESGGDLFRVVSRH